MIRIFPTKRIILRQILVWTEFLLHPLVHPVLHVLCQLLSIFFLLFSLLLAFLVSFVAQLRYSQLLQCFLLSVSLFIGIFCRLAVVTVEEFAYVETAALAKLVGIVCRRGVGYTGQRSDIGVAETMDLNLDQRILDGRQRQILTRSHISFNVRPSMLLCRIK